MSSNPFRKKTVEAIDTAKTRTPSPAKSSLRSNSPLSLGGKPRTVKKVRVLSPPPLSPDSPVWPTAVDDNALANSLMDHQPPGSSLAISWPAVSNEESVNSSPPFVASRGSTAQATPPLNPFSKTLQDLESSKELQSQRKSEGYALKVGNSSTQSLNVDSFRRLLLTGNVNDVANDDVSSSSRASSIDGDDTTTSPTNVSQSTTRDKRAPPPPPSSRHGKSLKDSAVGLGGGPDAEPEATESVSGQEIGTDQVPELETQRAAATQLSERRKSAPAPPPRRGHGRTESRSTGSSSLKVSTDDLPTSVSPVETPSRTEGWRQSGKAPNPPPPRRPRLSTPTSPPTAPSSQPSSTPSRSQEGDDERPSPMTAPDDGQPEIPKSAAPPPRPPTRNSSIRRRTSVGSVESNGRRALDGAAPPPPPPPPRQRGGSIESVDALTRHEGPIHSAPTQQGVASVDGATDDGKGSDILADLDALQREVDALRGKLG
ncbi:hypothetical protein GQ602_000556 [Ophiocordyceps camponoti-floridani]|uniref:Uncharacterized protein n=1 Tax=Ophiocordyceps camponoti-floridani TaxID=2030778 RepID=A0A8H4VGE6_9HYPO|nr:hypothetical protein GQ602_000556 [Ophiocordyceps camponoti-floridani]